jgi:hypothetical protein
MTVPLFLAITFALLSLPAGIQRSKGRITRVNIDENVIFFPTLSRRTADAAADAGSADATGWEVPIHGWIYEPEESSLRRRAFIKLLRKVLDLEKGEEASLILARRVRLFMRDNEGGKALTVELVGDGNDATLALARKRLPRSSSDGHFGGMLRISNEQVESLVGTGTGTSKNAVLTVRLVQPNNDRVFTGRTHLLQPTGLSVVSDIDDTIKLSNVSDKKTLMKNTFLKEFAPVKGMPELYQRWSAEHDAAFHFVSSSPWQLYQELSDFMQRENFPSGTFHLKRIRVSSASTLLKLLKDPFLTKVRTIENIMLAYPKRTFVLVGDTGERDPEVYGEISRRFPGQVWRVYLRDVGDGSELTRFADAFAGVPNDVWTVFSDPSAIALPPEY